MTSWSELKPKLHRACGKNGVQKVADAIPADRNTVYRLLRGQTTRPSKAIKAGIEKLVKDQKG